jgi:hypothetical protein
MKKKWMYFLCLILLSSCLSTDNFYSSIGIQEENVNNILVLEPGAGQTNFTNDEVSYLELVNASDIQVTLPEGLTAHLYIFQDFDWVEIDNDISGANNNAIVSPSTLQPVGYDILIVPNIPNLSAPITVIALVNGISEDSQQTQVYATYAFTLEP